MKGSLRFLSLGFITSCWPAPAEAGATASVLPAPGMPSIRFTLDLRQPGRPISTNLIGEFFEDINYAADDGL